MATRTSNTINPTNASNNIANWAAFVEDTLVTTGGWVVTSDTGQTAPASLTTPGAGNTKAGYRIYRMADSLQSTYPVFLRIDYGSAAAATTPGMWLTIGTGSNGSGTITGILLNGGAVSTPTVNQASATTPLTNNCYGSASTNRFSIALFVQSNGSFALFFSLERTKDSSGADTGDGLLLAYTDPVTGSNAGSLQYSRYILMTPGQQPSAELGLSYILTRQNPSETFGGGDVGVGIVIPYKGVAQQPGANVVINNNSDVSAEGSFSLTLYGATRTYQNIRFVPTKATVSGSLQDSNARVNMRYD